MRWFLGGVAAVVVLVLLYLGSAASSLSALAAAVRAGDGVAVAEHTDIKALRSSLSDQIVAAYLDRIGEKRQVRPMEKMLISAFGSGIADAMIAKMLTAENLTKILKAGKLDGAPGLPAIDGLPALGDLDTGNVLALLDRLRFVKPVQLAVRVSNTSDPEQYAAIDLHYEDLGWKLAGITLPRAVVRNLAATLPDK
jgi:hypothetical protein